ncbi:chemotaxis protein CheX [Paenibacillus segetis]|uniref:Chemotaxis protein CheX n=1 Tax=Paenibacillus segetis TaxID=1325360 RepID=A0ABQ1Y983_9BACL|nr:chemotaxis protein CheX [Paenibacillus segetis]GGH16080.1 chemotaxis protein CheX [Paenibacillus segetis]
MTDLTHPFFKATQEVFRLMLDLDIKKTPPEQLSELKNKAVNVSIGIIGDLEGKIEYCIPESITLEIVRILSGMEMKELDDFVTSAISEVVNIISGNAMTGLFDHQVQCDIQPPSIEYTDTCTIQNKSDKVLTLETSIGQLHVDIQLVRKVA